MAANSRLIKAAFGWPAIALVAALTAFAASLLADLWTVVDYVFAPLLAAVAVWIVAGVVRLLVVGFLRTDDDELIPVVLDRWFDGLFAFRTGVFGALLLLVMAIIVIAVAGGPVEDCVEALAYLAFLRIFVDLTFGTLLNIGILSRRRKRPPPLAE